MRLIAGIQQRLVRFLTDEVTIERPVVSVGAYGAPITTYEVEDIVKGRIITQSRGGMAAFATTGNMLAQREVKRVVLPVGTRIETGWRIRVRDDLYRVTAVREALTDAVDTQAWIEQWSNES